MTKKKAKQDADLAKFKLLIKEIIEAELEHLVQQAVDKTISEIEKRYVVQKHNPFSV